jgi:thiamine biosynthesis protein ThiC
LSSDKEQKNRQKLDKDLATARAALDIRKQKKAAIQGENAEDLRCPSYHSTNRNTFKTHTK